MHSALIHRDNKQNQRMPQSCLPLNAVLFLFSCAVLLPCSLPQRINPKYQECAATNFTCAGIHTEIKYPFWTSNTGRYCGHPAYYLSCSEDNTTLSIHINERQYAVTKGIDYDYQVLTIVDADLVGPSCPQKLTNTTVEIFKPFFSYAALEAQLVLFLNCSSVSKFSNIHATDCKNGMFGQYSYFWFHSETSVLPEDLRGSCDSTIVLPVYPSNTNWSENGPVNFLNVLREGFGVTWTAGQGWCGGCTASGGLCVSDPEHEEAHTCFCPDGNTYSDTCDRKKKKNTKYIVIGVCVGAALLLAACGLFFVYKRMKEKLPSASNLLDRTSSSEPSSMKDPEYGSSHYQTPIFSYKELQEATNNFDESLELGDGGFGTVYKGKLRDGRTVAVKRLYENNYKRIEQFSNEIAILSRLRHQNLVTLYGCTSRHSRELLLVYEFVPKGTVADHLHGPFAHEGVLTWPVRMNIAIETADALGYLHAVEPQIIHRDVKTNNILLDCNFHVKVADFGLSRLFPVDATHVSTAPQGTPGYVDPEYHQCYQLTDKSDVYSFGVVLVELISSMPAVDITRDRHEINLANLAINKIQNGEVDRLIDPMLGCDADFEIKRMITLVAELAFRCLQADRDLRPAIREVLEVLQGIQNSGRKAENATEMDMPARDRDDARLLKTLPYSPDTVVDKWSSRSTTPNASK